MTTAPATPDTANPPAPASDTNPPATPPVADNGSPQADGEPAKGNPADENNTDNTPPAFVVPESYKDKPWAAKVKSVEDLWKLTENSQQLIGRKQVVPDFANATPTEIEQFRAQMRPADEKAYDMSAGEENYQASELDPHFAKAFHKAGLHPAMANELIKDLKGVLNTAREKAFDADGFLSDMEKSFGNGYEVKVNQTRQVIEANLSPADKAALESIPNQYLGVLFRLANNMHKAYGASEKGLAGEHNANAGAPVDIGKMRSDLRKQIQDLDRRPHSAEDKQRLVDQLNATYSAKK